MKESELLTRWEIAKFEERIWATEVVVVSLTLDKIKHLVIFYKHPDII